MTGPKLTELSHALPSTVPFVGPEAQERARGQTFRARLGANENAFGPSPKALDAMREAAAHVWKYGDPVNHDLKQALAEHYNIAAGTVVVGEGIDGLLGDLVRLFVTAGDAVVTSDGAYPTFNFHVTGYGGHIHLVPYRKDHEDSVALAEMAHEVGAKLVYLANPDNPMGTLLPASAILTMLEAIPNDCLLVLDEAYVEFAPEHSTLPADFTHPNLIRMRTFSKAYGMAGARIGYAIAPEWIATAFDKVRNHFGVNLVAQAGARAALADQSALADILQKTEAAKHQIAEIGSQNGLLALPSATNFVCLDCSVVGADARATLSHLSDAGIFVRMPFVPPGDRCIRVSAGPAAEIALFGEALPKAIALAKASPA